MATLDNFREASGTPIRLDTANGWIADVRLNAGDMDGRTITVALTDAGTPISDLTGLSAALSYNADPGHALGDRTPMTIVAGATTATFRAIVPRKALLKPGRILLGIEIRLGDTRICSRTFHGIVERAVFDATSPEGEDAMGTLEKLIADTDTARQHADTAAANAAASARKADEAATNANASAANADSSATKAETATTHAEAAATRLEQASITMGTVATSPSGGDAKASLDGDGLVKKLNLTLPRGEKGEKGENTAAINTVTASVDATTGTPAVTVTASGTPQNRDLKFTFTGLKGADGGNGRDGLGFWISVAAPTEQDGKKTISLDSIPAVNKTRRFPIVGDTILQSAQTGASGNGTLYRVTESHSETTGGAIYGSVVVEEIGTLTADTTPVYTTHVSNPAEAVSGITLIPVGGDMALITIAGLSYQQAPAIPIPEWHPDMVSCRLVCGRIQSTEFSGTMTPSIIGDSDYYISISKGANEASQWDFFGTLLIQAL